MSTDNDKTTPATFGLLLQHILSDVHTFSPLREHNVRVDCDYDENVFLVCSCGWTDDTDATVADIAERAEAHIKDNDGRPKVTRRR